LKFRRFIFKTFGKFKKYFLIHQTFIDVFIEKCQTLFIYCLFGALMSFHVGLCAPCIVAALPPTLPCCFVD
jgi:hypothetical protein